MDDHPVVFLCQQHQPDIGSGDESKCIAEWINTLGDKWEKGEGISLSKGAVVNLLHTLVAAQIRTRRLVKERDEANVRHPVP